MEPIVNYLMWTTEGSFWRFLGQWTLIGTIGVGFQAGVNWIAAVGATFLGGIGRR